MGTRWSLFPRSPRLMGSKFESSSLELTATERKVVIPPLRKPLLTCPNVPSVPQELLDGYSKMPRMHVEEYAGPIFCVATSGEGSSQGTGELISEQEAKQAWNIAQFDVFRETRARLCNLAQIIKYFKRPMEKVMTAEETDRVFLTVEALFWYHLHLYHSLICDAAMSREKKIATHLLHFIEAACLDQAIFFTEYPSNMEFLDGLLKANGGIKNHYENGVERLNASESGKGQSLGMLMGHFYRRFQELKNQIGVLAAHSPAGVERDGLQQCKFLLDSFEMACGKLVEARVELVGLFYALSKADSSLLGLSNGRLGGSKQVFRPLDVPMDRRADMRDTIRQMQLNSRVRYNQAVKVVDYKPATAKKTEKFKVTGKEVSVSLFSRYIGLLEIILPPKKLFRKPKNDSDWEYRLLQPLLPFDQVMIEPVEEEDETKVKPGDRRPPFLVKFYLQTPPKLLFVFQCEDAKHKKDLVQQFRLILKEACPKEPIECGWRYKSAYGETPTEQKMAESDERFSYFRFDTSQCASGSTVSVRSDSLVRLTSLEAVPA